MSPFTSTLLPMGARQLTDVIPITSVLITGSWLSSAEGQIHFKRPPQLEMLSSVTLCSAGRCEEAPSVNQKQLVKCLSYWSCLSSSIRHRSSLWWLYFCLRHSLKWDVALQCELPILLMLNHLLSSLLRPSNMYTWGLHPCCHIPADTPSCTLRKFLDASI